MPKIARNEWKTFRTHDRYKLEIQRIFSELGCFLPPSCSCLRNSYFRWFGMALVRCILQLRDVSFLRSDFDRRNQNSSLRIKILSRARYPRQFSFNSFSSTSYTYFSFCRALRISLTSHNVSANEIRMERNKSTRQYENVRHLVENNSASASAPSITLPCSLKASSCTHRTC